MTNDYCRLKATLPLVSSNKDIENVNHLSGALKCRVKQWLCSFTPLPTTAANSSPMTSSAELTSQLSLLIR